MMVLKDREFLVFNPCLDRKSRKYTSCNQVSRWLNLLTFKIIIICWLSLIGYHWQSDISGRSLEIANFSTWIVVMYWLFILMISWIFLTYAYQVSFYWSHTIGSCNQQQLSIMAKSRSLNWPQQQQYKFYKYTSRWQRSFYHDSNNK